MKKGLVIILSLFILIGISSNVYALEVIGELDYWESNANNIASFMNKTPDIYSQTLGTFNLTTLRQLVANARNQWAGAGVPCNITTTESIAEIKVYGGSLQEIQSVEPLFLSSDAGLTISSQILQTGAYLYNGGYKNLFKIVSAIVYVRTGLAYPANAVTHEIGHSLGWRGHISASGHVMYGTASSVVTLTVRDKRHLSQIH